MPWLLLELDRVCDKDSPVNELELAPKLLLLLRQNEIKPLLLLAVVPLELELELDRATEDESLVELVAMALDDSAELVPVLELVTVAA